MCTHALAELVREVDHTFCLAGVLCPDLIRDELRLSGPVASNILKQLLERHVHLAEIFISERLLGTQHHVERAGRAGIGRYVEPQSLVPSRIWTTVDVDLGALPRALVAGDRHLGVDIHLPQEVHILEILRRDQSQVERSVRHG